MRRQVKRWARWSGLVVVGLMLLLEGGCIQAPTLPPIGTPAPHGIGVVHGAQYRASRGSLQARGDDHSKEAPRSG